MSEEQQDDDYLRRARALEASYLNSDDPIKQSGFAGGRERWEHERGIINQAIDRSGHFLDIGCANGFLLECIVRWAQQGGHQITPCGLDINPGLIAIARSKLPKFANNFIVADAVDWRPQRRVEYIYVLSDCYPAEIRSAALSSLFELGLVPGGKLILGSYGSSSRGIQPGDVTQQLLDAGLNHSGEATARNLQHPDQPIVTRIAWVTR